MSAWTDAVEALNPELWLKLDPVEPKTFVNSGYGNVSNDLTDGFWSRFDWGVSAFGAPGGLTGEYTFGNTKFTASGTASARTVLAFFRWQGHDSIWNSVIIGTGYNGNYFCFSGAHVAVYGKTPAVSNVLAEGVLDGNWHLLGFSTDTSFSRLYLDGKLILESPANVTDYENGYCFFGYGGCYDECLGFSRILSDAEIASLWNAAEITGLHQLTPYDMSGQRMALDVDGSIVTVKVRAGEEMELSTQHKNILVDGGPSLVAVMVPVKWEPSITILFPEPRDIFGFFIAAGFGSNLNFESYEFPASFGTSLQVSRTVFDLSPTGWETVPIGWGRGFLLGMRAISGSYFGGFGESTASFSVPAGGRYVSGGALIDSSLVKPSDVFSNSLLSGKVYSPSRFSRLDQVAAVDPPVRGVTGVRILLSRLGYYRSVRPIEYNYNTCISLQALYLYGQKSNSDSNVEHSLDIWKEERYASLELNESRFGDVALRSSEDFRFCVTNRSSRTTARNIVIRSDTLIDNKAAPFSSQFLFRSSADLTGKFNRQITIGSLAPGEQSETIVVRRVTPSFADEGAFLPRVLAQVGRWD